MEFLFKIFIKDKDNVKDEKVRNSYGVFGGIVGIVLNFLLFATKLFAGFVTGSVGIAADALNNLSDAGSSVITLIGFKMSGRPADYDHPFGHGRWEYISGLFVAFLILLMGVELAKASLGKIFNPVAVEFNIASGIILVIAILTKLWMYFFNLKIAKKIDSKSLIATAKDSLSDSLSTLGILAGVVISKLFSLKLDGYIGLLMSALILWTGYKTIKEAISPLLGIAPDKELVEGIERTILDCDEIIGMHDLIIHNYGPTRFMMSVHAEVRADCDILKIHDRIDLVEKALSKKYGCDAVIHLDPIETDNEIINHTKEVVEKIAADLDTRLTIHDFRMVTGDTHTNVIFDIVIPFDEKLSDRFIEETIRQKLSEYNENYFAVIHIDKAYYN
jgi:cation diffusion facilitator family transporter